MSKREIHGSRAIVTGASSGIGYELARQLAQARARVVVVARREDRLRELADRIARDGGEVEAVVGDITDPATEVNFFAPVELIRLALPLLRDGNRPIIVNVSSILGLRGVPYSSEYCASKFAVQGFSEAIRTELVRHGIDVLVVNPGTTETEFFDKVIEQTDKPTWPEHAPVSAAAVAKTTIRAIRRGRHAIIPYKWGKVLCWLNRLSPSLVDRIMARY
jgi:short-subunit dehydrogenase